DLIPGLEVAVKEPVVEPRAVISLYWNRPQPGSWGAVVADTIEKRGVAWVVCAVPMGGVALLFPTAILDDLIAEYQRDDAPHDDVRIHACAMRLGLEWWSTWPSLVDHRDETTLLPKEAARWPRVAARFIGQDASAL